MERLKRIIAWAVQVLGSRWFFYGIIGLTIAQALWYALSFQPVIFDEARHFGVIAVYAQQWSPFIAEQLPAWDNLGNLVRDPTYLYYYLMSLPLRVVQVFTDSFMVQVIALRLVHVLFFVAGLYLYRTFFRGLGASDALIHTIFLLLILGPAIAPLPGAINYDTAIFLLSGAMLVLAQHVLRAKTAFPIRSVLGLLIIGLGGVLIKHTFIAFSAPVLLFIAVFLLMRWRSGLVRAAATALRQIPTLTKFALVCGAVLAAILFIERPVMNVVHYGGLSVDCVELMEQARCEQNYTQARNIAFAASRPVDFTPQSLPIFFVDTWARTVIDTHARLVGWLPAERPVLWMIFLVAAAGGVLILLRARHFWRRVETRFLLVITGVYVLAVVAYNYLEYRALGQPVAITSRYLLPILPLFLYLALNALMHYTRERSGVLVAITALVLLGIPLGGGIVTHARQAEPSYYWNSLSSE